MWRVKSMSNSNSSGKVGEDDPEPPLATKLNCAAKPFVMPTRRPSVAPSSSQGDSNGNKSGSQIQEVPDLPARPVESQTVQVCPSNQPAAGCSITSSFSHPNLHLPYETMVLDDGAIRLSLRDSIIVEMTVNGSVKVVNGNYNVAIAVSSDSMATALHHPNGIVFQNGPRVDIAAVDASRKYPYIRFAKMWQKGISMTTTGCALIYLVDAGGTRTTMDMISMSMETDYVDKVFSSGKVHTANNYADQWNVIQSSSYKLGAAGSVQIRMNGYRIIQDSDGFLKIYWPYSKTTIRTSPTNGCATVTTSAIHCTASLGASTHMFVRCKDRRMHFDGATFIVRNAGHSAGFDERNRLCVY